MIDQGVVVLGIPIPSTARGFLTILTIHVGAGLVCAVAGIVAMLAPKQPGRHPRAGGVYFWSLVVVFLTMTVLTILRWPANKHLFVLGVASFVAGAVGRRARRRMQQGWAPVHVSGMATSYILLLTAFYVDNGPHLPLWRTLPRLVHWLLPSVIGVPMLWWVLRRHPLVIGPKRGPSAAAT